MQGDIGGQWSVMGSQWPRACDRPKPGRTPFEAFRRTGAKAEKYKKINQ